eukprot:5150546-Pyramimonas_sp.AAC.1
MTFAPVISLRSLVRLRSQILGSRSRQQDSRRHSRSFASSRSQTSATKSVKMFEVTSSGVVPSRRAP